MRRARSALTLLEVLIVLAILGILLAITYANLRPMYNRTLLRQGATEIATALRTARSEAQRFNTTVTLSISPTSSSALQITRGDQTRTITLPEGVTLQSIGATNTVAYGAPHGIVAVTGAAFRVSHSNVDTNIIVGVTGLPGKVVISDES